MNEFINNFKLAGGEILEKIPDDWYVIKGEFGVSENGSIWVKEYKKELFLSENVAIIIDRVVDTMHEAIKLVDSPGVFVSGPSKTADIENFLVFGAHGPIRVGVFIKN